MNDHDQLDDSSAIVGHPDVGVVDGPSQWKKYAAAGAFVAVLAGGVTFGVTRDGGEAAPPADDSADLQDEIDSPLSAQPDVFFGPVDDTGTDTITAGSDDVLLGDPSDDLLPPDPSGRDEIPGGDPSGDLITGGPSDDVIIDDVLLDEPVVPPVPTGLRQVCFDVRHQEVPAQDAATGIWVEGSLYGFPEGTWIWVQGPTINGGEGVEIPLDPSGGFDAPLGINAYGEHPIEAFELRDADGHPVVDFLVQLADRPGTTLTVGPEEGAPFDQPCFDFEPLDTVDDAPASGVPAAPQVEGESPTIDSTQVAQTFFDGFVADHLAGDSEALIAGLHPVMREAFGPAVCDDYIRSTTGSIGDATVHGAGDPRPLEVAGPDGTVVIPDAMPVQVDLVLTDGTVLPTDANLALSDGEVHWLTRCGVD